MKNKYFLGVSPEGFHHIAYTEWGVKDPQAPTVLCIHGYSRNGRDFDHIANHLSSKGRHVLCPDIVGRGDSSWFHNPSNYNFTQYTQDMACMISRSESQNIDLIGTSMGGIIGMMLASLPNSPIRRLVLNDVGPQIPIHGLKRLSKYIGKDPEFKSLEEAKQLFKINYSGFGITKESDWDDFTLHTVEQKGPNRFVSKMDPAVKNPKSTLHLIADFLHHPHKTLEGILYDIDLWYLWKQLKCPVLVVHGVYSDILTPEIIKQMQRTHNNISVLSIDDAGHAPALIDKSQHEYIERWLNS
ncbi:alpha/beta fold hydrolase [Legionella waltersii]|uniref:Hydrolase/acyltransferase n=1 Tax=Legionella waltersii TaxID=66969 RepID=A0A0W1AMF5_9GAMM|nr:alpha/beta hydrolase [Legionella waltersii]KTD82511.1 hydrolase/acyltransferase [Legionella waltersii]SNV02976.1 hydrolase [Legionella waltersii]